MNLDGRTLSHEMSETICRIAVQRVKEGEKPSVVIRSFGLGRTSIYRWLTAERTHGATGLAARAHPGRQPALTPRQKVRV